MRKEDLLLHRSITFHFKYIGWLHKLFREHFTHYCQDYMEQKLSHKVCNHMSFIVAFIKYDSVVRSKIMVLRLLYSINYHVKAKTCVKYICN